jgi:YD repeat-containing protein
VATLAVADQTTKYAYDALGRLRYVQVTGGPTTGTAEYRYDASGNRTRYIVSGSTSSGTLSITPFGSNLLETSIGLTLGVHVAGFPPANGVVTFKEGTTTLGYAAVNGGDASVILEGFALGTHTITAEYSGDSFNKPYSYTFTITVRNLDWLPAVIELLLSN